MGRMKKVGPRAEKAAVLRILAGKSDPEKEALRLGVHVRTVEKMVAPHRPIMVEAPVEVGQVPPPVSPSVSESPETPGNAVSPEVKAETGVKTPYQQAMEAAEGSGKTELTTGEVEAAVKMAEHQDADMCLEIIGGLKTSVGCTLAGARFGLPPMDPEVQKLTGLGVTATAVVKANAVIIAPQLRKWMGGWGPIALALSADMFAMMIGLKGLAVKRGTMKKPPASEAKAPLLHLAPASEPQKPPAPSGSAFMGVPGAPPPAGGLAAAA